MIYLYFFILVLLSAFFSACEIAFFSLTHAQVRLMTEKKAKNAKYIWRLKKRPQKLLITILIGNNVVNVLIAALATLIATDIFGSLGVGIATGVVTLIILVFGEIVPKSFAQKNNNWMAQRSAFLIYLLSLLFWPLIWLLVNFNDLVIKYIFHVKDPSLVTEEEIRSLTRLGVETGAIDYREREMIEKVFRFNDIEVGDIITPRYKMVVLNGEVPVEQIAYFVSHSGFSRYPVYVDDEDNIVGYIHVNDLMKVLNSDERETLVKDLVRPIRRVKESGRIEPLFRSILKNQDHQVLVVRESNKEEIIGLVTLEDILEELVGDISDETDEVKEVQKL